MKNDKIIYRIINGKGENRRLDRRYVFLSLFVFIMVAAFSFFYTRGMNGVSAVNLSGFKPGNIMSDDVMRNYTSMSEAEIQTFLSKKNSCNKAISSVSGLQKESGKAFGVSYQYKLPYGSKVYYYHVENNKFVCLGNEKFDGETAAHIIYKAAQDYRINPQVLIVLLQKEQGLITDAWPNVNYQYRSATGYGCPDTAPCNAEYYGFKNQVRKAAELFDLVLSGKSKFYPIKKTQKIRFSPNASCGSGNVYIENYATSALYRYTPYQPNAAALKAGFGSGDGCSAYGNRNFYGYFTDWFGSTQTVPAKVPSSALTGDLFKIEIESGKFLVPQNKTAGSALTISSSAAENDRQYKFAKSGEYYIITHVGSGMVLGSSSSNDKVELQKSNGSNNQKWRITALGAGYLLHSAENDRLVFDLSNGVTLKYSGDTAKQSVKFVSVQQQTNKTTAPKQEDTSRPIADGSYTIYSSVGKNYVLDIYGLSARNPKNGANLQIWSKLNNTDTQTFNVKYDTSKKLYLITNMYGNSSIDVAHAGSANHTNVWMYEVHGTCAQYWRIVKNSDNTYSIGSSCSDKYLDVDNAKAKNGTNVQMYARNTTVAQKWVFVKTEQQPQVNAKQEDTSRPIADGSYTIYSSVGKNYVLDIYGLSARNPKNGANLQIWSKLNNTDTQTFNVKYDTSKKLYLITNMYGNSSIDVAHAGSANHTNVWMYEVHGTCAQYWRIVKNSDNTYSIGSSCSDKYLDVDNAKAKNGTNVQMYARNTTVAQKWVFSKN